MAVERVLITGGTGFIGRALAERLLARNVGVDVLSRDRRRAWAQFEGRVRAVESLDEIGRDRRHAAPDAIVNLAGKNLGEERWNRRVKRELIGSRLAVTRHVVDYIRSSGRRPRVLISGSAVGYYGARGSEVLDESAGPGDEYQSRLCVEWEDMARRAADYGVRTCISRTGVVLGRGGGVLAGLAPLFRKGLGAVVGSGRQWISWIHLEDLLRLFEDLIEDEGLAGAFNNTAPAPATHREFAMTLGRALRRPVLLRIPAAAYRVAIGELARLHTTGQYVVPARHLARGFEHRFARLDEALAAALNAGGGA